MKYNLSKIARRANVLTATMIQSAAWKKAWAEEKIAIAEAALFALEMKDRWDAANFEQSRTLNAVITAQRATIAPALTIVKTPAVHEDKAAKAKAIFAEAIIRKDQPVINSILFACGPVVNETYEKYFGNVALAA